MAFSLIGGGSSPAAPLLAPPGLLPPRAGCAEPGGPEPGALAQGEPGDIDAAGSYEDAVLLNQQLKALLAAAQAVTSQADDGSSPGQGGSRQRRPPRAPAGRCQAAPRQGSQGPSRRQSNGTKEPGPYATRNAACGGAGPRPAQRSRSCMLPPLATAEDRRGLGSQGSQDAGRRTPEQRSLTESFGMLEEGGAGGMQPPHSGGSRRRPTAASLRSRSCGPPDRGGGLPKGWTRGLGGRMLPPPELRWGSTKYDAGDWNS